MIITFIPAARARTYVRFAALRCLRFETYMGTTHCLSHDRDDERQDARPAATLTALNRPSLCVAWARATIADMNCTSKRKLRFHL